MVADPSLCNPSTFHSTEGFLLLTHFLQLVVGGLLFELQPSLLELHALFDDPSPGL